ncbi:NUDIX hydrolase [Neobacillus piezotolerans]|uniref:NUDIX hydrolase n=1 Tax=Neobacillus piezotolerans TaxID=2259171 RepID=A0A3D8GU80_9BACI|nr:NUDIX domain-containing protein [Neobacillus piezotolerans]RDU38008.1 NUDIX hydrolase [Neobacillus piezotolerans]
MTTEIIRIFDGDMNCIGEKAREEVHRTGDWHETFHCWFSLGEDILVQKRSKTKKDYPGLFDITSAGHLMADETIQDGVRELEEELGVKLQYNDLISLGIIKEEIKLETIYDREFCHVFLYECGEMPTFTLQEEEVESIHKIRLEDALNLFNGVSQTIEVTPVDGGASQNVSKDSFVGHDGYYIEVFKRIKELRKKPL